MKKKPTSVRFQIPEPCDQIFDKMHPLPGGRHCDKCEKTIVDFTNISDGELLRIYQKRQGRICGVFRADQLNRNMRLLTPIEKSNNWKAIAAFTAALVFGNVTNGQTNGIAENIPKKEMLVQDLKPKMEIKTNTISGWVTDDNDVPIMYASVYLNGLSKGTVTDDVGRFSIEVPADIFDQELTVSYVGCEAEIILWTKEEYLNRPLNVVLKKGLMLTEVVVTAESVRAGCTLVGYSVAIFKDNNGKEIETPKPIENADIINIFPNPFTSHISINIELKKPENYIFHLYSESGQLVFAESHELLKGTQTVRLNLNQRNLPEGIYFLRISDGIGEIKTKRVVKVSP